MKHGSHGRFALLGLLAFAGAGVSCGGGGGGGTDSPQSETGAGGATSQAPATATAPSATNATQSDGTGTIVPLYAPPGDPSWQTVAATKQAHPSVPIYAVVNPSNGPGAAPNAEYRAGTDALAAAGVRVIGYVATGYGSRDPAAARADMDRWHAWYPAVSGIFFDEQAYEDGRDGYYRALTAYAHTQGLTFTIGNPGVDTRPCMVGATDVILIYESQGLPDVQGLKGWHSQYPRKSFGVIPHSAALSPTWLREARQAVGFIYVTDHTLPNPWYGVPANFPDLVAALDQQSPTVAQQ